MILDRGVWMLQHTRLEGGGMMFLRLRHWIEQAVGLSPLVTTPQGERFVHLVAVEDVKAHKGTAAAHLYGGIVSTITSVLEEDDARVAYTGVGVGTWKKLATGKGNASKDEVAAAAIKRWGGTANGSGLICNWTQDEADAAFIALAAGAELGWLDLHK
jgi:Holliday junction resolvasome RuvABC endonuclease subunit